jgi:hypothetical protein
MKKVETEVKKEEIGKSEREVKAEEEMEVDMEAIEEMKGGDIEMRQ